MRPDPVRSGGLCRDKVWSSSVPAGPQSEPHHSGLGARFAFPVGRGGRLPVAGQRPAAATVAPESVRLVLRAASGRKQRKRKSQLDCVAARNAIKVPPSAARCRQAAPKTGASQRPQSDSAWEPISDQMNVGAQAQRSVREFTVAADSLSGSVSVFLLGERFQPSRMHSVVS